MALISLWGAPPGVVLASAGMVILLVPALRRGRRPGVLWTGAALVGLVRLASGAGTGSLGFRPATLEGAGTLVPVAAGLLGAALLYGIVLLEARRGPVLAQLGWVAAVTGGSVAGLFAGTMSGFLAVFCLAQLAAVATRLFGARGQSEGPIGGRITSALSFVTVLGSGALLFAGWNQRRLAGGADLHDWVGTPFSGDAPSGLLFCGLALPVLLPGIVGGFSHAFLRRRIGGSGGYEPSGFGLPGLCVAALVLAGLQVQFSGAQALGAWGVAGAGLALVAGGFAGWLRPSTAGEPTQSSYAPQADGAPPKDSQPRKGLTEKRLAAWVQGTVGLILVGSSAASESSEAAFGYAVISALPALAGLAIASARLSHERDRHRGMGPKGMGHLFPSTMIFSGLLGASLLAFPWTLGFLARSQALGALVLVDGELAAIAAVALGVLMALLVVLPWFQGLFLSPGAATDDPPPRPSEPKAQRAALGLASALMVAFGWVPDGLSVLVPSSGAPASTFPSAYLQLGLLFGAVMVFLLWVRLQSAHFQAPTDRKPGYPPGHEAK